MILGRTLPKWGYQPIIVANGEQAWQHLQCAGGPSIAILDWVMPLMDGLEVCRRVRSGNLERYVYLILLTSKGTSEDLMSGLEAGADDYLPKPVNPAELRLRLRAGCRVLEAEGQHRHIAENASDGIVTLQEGNLIHFANSAAGAIFGYPRTALPGLDFTTLAPDFERHLRGAGIPVSSDSDDAGRIQSWDSVEIIGRHRTGRCIVLEVSFAESHHSEQGRKVTAMIRDVTERRRLDRQRTQVQKLESIGELAAGVAHEINTPIQYIGDNLRFLKDSYDSLHTALQNHRRLYTEVISGTIETATVSAATATEETVDFEFLDHEMPCAMEQALEGVQHVAGIVRALKEFANPGILEVASTDLNHLIETVVLVSRNQWSHVAELNTNLDPAIPLVECVAGEINQVLLNLIVNATDAISVAQKGRPGARGVITICTRAVDGCAEIRISDSGTGIPPDLRSRIFDPFFTTKEVGQGSGQGLALTHAVVQKHHGTIDFETTVGVGTTFIIRLPLQPLEESLVEQVGSNDSALFIPIRLFNG
jgi:PAS domain S-box-containing protein